jgi:hypothetical protein
MLLRRVIEHVRAQNWTAVGIDFVIVVVGILLALQISEWSQARQDRVRERAYLARMAAELQQSFQDIEASIEIAQEREALGRLLIDSVDDEEPVRADPGRYLVALLKGGYTYSPEIRSHAFDELRSSGDLGLIKDKVLLVAITEFYTEIREAAQWSYIREARQTEYMKRAAGILLYDQMKRASARDELPETTVDEALEARARMLERPAFIEWLPTMVDRTDDIHSYRQWLQEAKALRDRIQQNPVIAGGQR